MQIQAAVLYAPRTPFQVETVELQPPQPGEVLVKMVAAGVCHSDWHLMTGDTQHNLPVVPGHEGAGIVAAVSDGVTRVQPGDHIVLNWAPNCGRCFYCLNDKSSLCESYTAPIWEGTMLDGTTRLSKDGQTLYHFSGTACFATHTVVPQECCVPLNPAVPFPIGAVIGCAVTTGVGSVLNTAQIRPGSSVAVFGLGGVGLSIIMGAKLAMAHTVIGIDKNSAKLEMARAMGADHVLETTPSVNSAIKALTEGRGADYVFEAIGLPEVQEQCLEVVRPGGTVVLVGVSPMGSATNLPGAIITRQEKTVMGSYYGSANTARDFPLFADLYLNGQLRLDLLMAKEYPLTAINEAFDDMLNAGLGRGVIVF